MAVRRYEEPTRLMNTDADILTNLNQLAASEIPLQDYQALAEFRYQIRRYIRFAEQAARAVGVEPQHHQLLLTVKGMPEGKRATVGEIAERLQIQHHSTVELIDRLVERGLVLRQRDEEDQRRVLISLTTQGEEILHQLSQLAVAELRMTGPALVKALNTLVNSVTSST